jgi:hypothetical protein
MTKTIRRSHNLSAFSPNFVIGNIQIGVIEGASCLNMGNNYPTNFQSKKKHNQGFGNVSGNQHHLDQTKSMLYDSKAIDSLTFDNGQEIPEWLKTILHEKLRDTP